VAVLKVQVATGSNLEAKGVCNEAYDLSIKVFDFFTEIRRVGLADVKRKE